jgi:guanosine-3',5'-bis(diphosphate) 3'-pyrophosphohydrolase
MTPKRFAIEAHGDQHYGDAPYVAHLQAVHDVLVEFGYLNEDLLAAAWLHDVLEDTTTTFEDLSREFGLRVAQIVKGVTNELGKNRAERHAKTYPKIASDLDCVTLKLADRIANMRASLTGKKFIAMYRGEYPEFRAALRPGGGCEAMWIELDRLAGYATSQIGPSFGCCPSCTHPDHGNRPCDVLIIYDRPGGPPGNHICLCGAAIQHEATFGGVALEDATALSLAFSQLKAKDAEIERLKARVAELEHIAKVRAVQADWDSRCIEEKKGIVCDLSKRLIDADESNALWEKRHAEKVQRIAELKAQLKRADEVRDNMLNGLATYEKQVSELEAPQEPVWLMCDKCLIVTGPSADCCGKCGNDDLFALYGRPVKEKTT